MGDAWYSGNHSKCSGCVDKTDDRWCRPERASSTLTSFTTLPDTSTIKSKRNRVCATVGSYGLQTRTGIAGPTCASPFGVLLYEQRGGVVMICLAHPDLIRSKYGVGLGSTVQAGKRARGGRAVQRPATATTALPQASSVGTFLTGSEGWRGLEEGSVGVEPGHVA